MIKRILLLSLFLCCFIACKKDKPQANNPDKPPTTPETSTKGGVFIINEGNFQWGNASLSYFNLSDSSLNSDLFKSANNRPLGDVFQSMEMIGKTAYLVVNNSGKIEVINSGDGKSIATISGLNSPRYFLPYKQKAYVSDYAGGAISVVDLNSNTLIKTIACKGWTEEMILSNGRVYVSNVESDFVYILNPETDKLTDSIKVGYGSNSIKKDMNGKLWVLCGGSEIKGKPGGIYRINPMNNSIEASFLYQNANQNPFKLSINAKGDVLYFIENGIQKLSINATALPASPLIAQESTNFWGLGIQPQTGHIYVADAIDYVQKGKIMIYSENGTFLHSFSAGVIPGDFYFK
ncbi:MAG: hypothetical protein H0X62_00780 [Bacteroidetes bacterium]|nr:hypothetical protein [Bacteroidota bacterium]